MFSEIRTKVSNRLIGWGLEKATYVSMNIDILLKRNALQRLKASNAFFAMGFHALDSPGINLSEPGDLANFNLMASQRSFRPDTIRLH
jgi:hypothetical protein